MSKIDWKKPIEFLYDRYDNKWTPCRVMVCDRKGTKYTHGILYRVGEAEDAYWVDSDGQYCGYCRCRNVPEKPKATKHIILTYRTASGKLSSTVKGMDFLNNGKKWSVGDYLNDNKVLHITEFELVA